MKKSSSFAGAMKRASAKPLSGWGSVTSFIRQTAPADRLIIATSLLAVLALAAILKWE